MRGAHACEALGLGFDHRAEGVAAVGALLLQVEAEGGEVFLAQGFGQQRPIAVRAQGASHGMWRQQRVVAQAAQAGAAGSGERGGVVRHAGADRIWSMSRGNPNAPARLLIRLGQLPHLPPMPGAVPGFPGADRCSVT